MTADIIEFPQSRIFRDVPTEAVREVMKKGAKNDAESLTALIFNQTLGTFHQLGLDNAEGDEQIEKDMLFMYDLIRAIVYRYFDLDHHLHDWLENHVTLKPLKEFGDAEKTNIILNDDDFDKNMQHLLDALLSGERPTPYDDLPSDVEPPAPKKEPEPKE